MRVLGREEEERQRHGFCAISELPLFPVYSFDSNCCISHKFRRPPARPGGGRSSIRGEEEAAAWGREVEALVTLLERAMEVALCVIGTAEEGLPGSLLFEKEEGEGQEEGEYRSETAVQTAGPGFVVDCRGHLIRSNGGGGKGGGAEDEDEDEEGAGDGDDDDYDDDTRSVVFVHPSCLCICTALTPSLSFMDV